MEAQRGAAEFSPFELGLLVGRVEAMRPPLERLTEQLELASLEVRAVPDHALFTDVGMRRYVAWLQGSEEEE